MFQAPFSPWAVQGRHKELRMLFKRSRLEPPVRAGPHFVLGLTVSNVFPVRCLISKLASAVLSQSHKPGILNPKQRSQKWGAGTQKISLLILLQSVTFTTGFSLCPPSFNSSNREKNEKNDFFFKRS